VVVDGHLERERFPSTVRTAAVDDVLSTLATPLIRNGQILGAVSLSRRDLSRPYSQLDLEVAPIVAGLVALAIANASLHAHVSQAATRDALTGLANRRHLDASLERLAGARDRMDPEDRRPLSAILFDLDEFGAFNKMHGHKVGDTVLRTFAEMLAARFRSSDIVARYGGEEFLVVLDGASLDEARRAARHRPRSQVSIESRADPWRDVSAGCSALGRVSRRWSCARGRRRRPPDGQARRSQPGRRGLTRQLDTTGPSDAGIARTRSRNARRSAAISGSRMSWPVS
jgi:diguanylate cyclase (GGDEF)-like protein